jgi:hypothetical protein
MLCFPCATARDESPAVALCPHCHAGLCLSHVAQAATYQGRGGTRLGCGHSTWEERAHPSSGVIHNGLSTTATR